MDQHVKPIMVEQRRQGLEDQDIYFAIMDDRKKCFEEWEIFQFSNSNSTQSDNLNKKRKKLPAFISEDIIEIVPPSKKTLYQPLKVSKVKINNCLQLNFLMC